NHFDLNREILARAATDGDDVIHGFFTLDTLYGGAGNDDLHGGDSDDTYQWGRGDGNDRIFEAVYEYAYSDNDTLAFGAGVSLADLTINVDSVSEHLAFTIQDTGETLTIIDQFDYGGLNSYYNDIEIFSFADGSVYTAEDILSFYYGTAFTDGDDIITGTSVSEVFEGGLGDDVIDGGTGNDTYIYSRGDGHDILTDTRGHFIGQQARDTLDLRNISVDDVTLSQNGVDFTLTIAESAPGALDGGSIVLEDSVITNGFVGIDTVLFDDGTELTQRGLRDLYLSRQATDGDHTIIGFAAEDTLAGGLGNDILNGGDDDDTYVYTRGDGDDIIEGEIAGNGANDRLILHGIDPAGITVTFASTDIRLAIAESTPGANDGGLVILTGNLTEDGQLGVEEVHFDDGTVWTADYLRQVATPFVDNAGDDTFYGDTGDNQLIGGLGDDYLSGGDGSDTYIFVRGDGVDMIEDLGSGDTDRLSIQGYTPGETILSNVPGTDDVVVSFTGTTDQITIRNSLLRADADHIEEIVFDDGTVWSADDVLARAVSSPFTEGDDSISTGSGSQVLSGGLGTDALFGGDGSDTYIFVAGDGADEIDDNGFGDTDRLVIHGHSASSANLIRTTTTGDDLRITFDGSSDEILIWNTLNFSTSDEIEEIHFDDGTVWTISDVRALTIAQSQTDGDDTVSGYNSSETLSGGLGNDFLTGGDGSDTYVFNMGDGIDEIDDGGFGDTDRLVIHGYSPDQVIVSRTQVHSNDLKLNFVGSTDQITIWNTAPGSSSDRIEEIVFDDGTIWTSSQYVSLAIAATDFDDTQFGTTASESLYGGAGNDIIDGGSGNDGHFGGAGDDILIGNSGLDSFDGGDGIDTLDFRYTSSTLEIDLDAGFMLTSRGTLEDVLNIENILAGSGQNTLSGTSAANEIDAGGHHDVLVGRGGADILTGGSGSDVFRYDLLSDSTINATDVITDFDRSADVIDLSALNVVFADLVVTENAADTDVELANTDFRVKLDGTGHNLTADQFVF
ncbi:MAG: calcium-binding protein, partial [Pseudomonadota bacterium]